MNEIALFSTLMLLAFITLILLFRKKQKNKGSLLDNPKTFSIKKNPNSQHSPSPSPLTNGEITKRISEIFLPMKFEKLITLSFFAGVLAIVISITFPKISKIVILLGSTIFIPIGVIFGIFLTPNGKIKLLRKMTKQNYGYVKFITSNKVIKTIVANLNDDIIKFGNGIYFINRKMIKKHVENEVPSIIPIDENAIKYEDGIPTIYFDVDDIIPLDFSNIEKDMDEKFRLPSQVSATLNKEIAVEKAKIMNAFKRQQNILMIVIVVALLILLYLTYTDFTRLKTMSKTISGMNDALNSIKAIMSGGGT